MRARFTSPLRALAALAFATLQLACTALPAPPSSYAPAPATARPGGAYSSELEGATSARRSEYLAGGLAAVDDRAAYARCVRAYEGDVGLA